MNCEQTRERLAEWVYGDVAGGEAAALELHVSQCPGCCHERDSLEKTREMLNAPPAVSAEVDLVALYRAADERSRLGARRWRRVACALAAGLAASLLAILLSKVELRTNPNQSAAARTSVLMATTPNTRQTRRRGSVVGCAPNTERKVPVASCGCGSRLVCASATACFTELGAVTPLPNLRAMRAATSGPDSEKGANAAASSAAEAKRRSTCF